MTDALQLRLFNAAMESGMQDFTRLIGLCDVVLSCDKVPGAVVEMGVWRGNTAALMASLTKRDVWLYDSFEGLSQPGPNDLNHPPFQKGDMASREQTVIDMFENAGLKLPKIVKEDVRSLTVAHLPQSISCCHIDLDLETPTGAALRLVWPFMSSGGIIVIDDYRHAQLPGVKVAVDEFKAWLDITRLNKDWSWGRLISPDYATHAYFFKA